ncbi:hypothetical protein Q3C01_32455 [Bradyrhizobium sp. UFLA05-109]
MILSTHAIVGAALASLIPDHPVAAFVIGVASHFAIDAIPHVDYPLHSIRGRRSTKSALTLIWLLVKDLGLITVDAGIGLGVVLWLYGAGPAVLAGALGAMLPDPMRLVSKLYPKEPLRSLQRFHAWIHSKRKLSWPLGVVSQLCVVLLFVGLASALGGAN